MGITVVISSVLVSSEVGESPMRTELADVDKEKHGPTSYHSGEVPIKAESDCAVKTQVPNFTDCFGK